MANVQAASGAPIQGQLDFPLSPSAFDADERVSYSKPDQKFILETAAGTEYEWDSALKRWIPSLDQAAIDRQQAIYKVDGVEDDDAGHDDEEEGDSTQKNKKRKKGKNEASDQPAKKQRANTAVYVTNIPLDADEEEIKDVFGKCGMIAEEIDSGRSRIKMYTDERNEFKGDALIVYFRPESVQLAVQMLDDAEFRMGDHQGTMKVQVADFSYKQQKEVPAGDPAKNKSNQREKAKIIKKTQKMNSRLADWDDDDPSTVAETGNRWDKVVILKHMFTLQELEDEPEALLDIKEDIREECEKLGPVTNVQLFDKEPAGVASIRFANVSAAEACVRLMNGRWFDQRQLEASIATGKERFKKSGKKAAEEADEQHAEEDKRLDGFGKWLEAEKQHRGEPTQVREEVHHTRDV